MGLPWYRADTNFPTHDKVLDLVANGVKGKAAGFVYHCAMANAVANGTDGSIKRAALPFVHGTPADARLLVEAGLWQETNTGWQIRNFGTRQVVGASEQAKEDEVRAAKSEGGKKGAESRWSQ
jgi:hypothetical protein